MPRANWVNEAFYAVTERLRDECLLDDGSLFTPGRAVWTREAAAEWDASISVPDHSDRNFGEKLRDQLAGLSPAAVQFAAESLYVALLAEADTGRPKKREHIDNALSVLNEQVELPAEVDDALNSGIATYGQGGRNRRDAHLRYLASFVIELKGRGQEERRSLLGDPHAFRAFAYSVPERAGQMQREALLHLVFPDYFESTVSLTAKEKIVEAFSEYDATADEHLDARIASIREGLAEEYPEGFSFWDEELRAVWSQAGNAQPDVRAWLVRGANAFGENMLPRWFADGFISIGWPGAVSPPDPVVMDGVPSERFPVGSGDGTISFSPLPPPARIVGPASGNPDFHALTEEGMTYCSIGYSGAAIRADDWQGEREGDVVTCPWCELRLIGSGLLRASKAKSDVARTAGAAFEERPADAPFSSDVTREELDVAFRASSPDATDARVRMDVGNQHRYLAMRPGDLVVSPDGDKIYIGRVASEVYWVQEQLTAERRKVEWLNTESPASRTAIKEARPSLHRRLKTRVTVTDLKEDAAFVAGLVGGEDKSAWDEYVHWAVKVYAVPSFDAVERDYKLEIAAKMAEARRLAEADDPEWIDGLKRAFGPPNNLTRWQANHDLLSWCSANPEAAREFLAQLWGSPEEIGSTLIEWPVSSSPGDKISLASLLLLGVDPAIYPVFRSTVFTRTLELLDLDEVQSDPDEAVPRTPNELAAMLGISGLSVRNFLREEFPRPADEKWSRYQLDDEQAKAVIEHFRAERSSIGELGGRYGGFTAVLDEIIERLAERGTELRDRLDAQGIAWWLVYGDPPAEWSEEEQMAFREWRGEVTPREPPEEQVVVPIVPQGVADSLYVPQSWLQEIVDLLNQRRQIVFYGPPGTGKTYIAQRLGELVESVGGSFELVQFHPAYSYEDFFEGFRPEAVQTATGVSYALRPGPLRLAAKRATDEPSKPHVLVIDELNRGNVAKIFGELFFLLEYRDRAIPLQYSPEERFALPSNLYFIGTMNTADRSIALVDSALRRRFYFVPFLPTEWPLEDVLGEWLRSEGLDPEPALLLKRLNEAIGAQEFSIGPSYFMAARGPDGIDLERIWRFAIKPLLEEHYYGTGRSVDEFSFAALSRQIEDVQLEEAPLEHDEPEADEA